MYKNGSFFSIIMPAYNAQRFLLLALDSIKAQTYENYEVLLINDGSTDTTDSICKSYADKDARIVYINKPNEGVAKARNEGLNRAKGKYVMFMDADDILHPYTLSDLYKEIEVTHVDYLRYEYKTIDENGNDLYPNYEANKRNKISRQIVDAPTCIELIIRNDFFLWAGVFKRNIIEKHSLRFLHDCTYNEDTLFILQFLMYSHTHLYIPKTFYGYRKYNGAVTTYFIERNYQDIKRVFSHLRNIYNMENVEMQKAIKPVIETLGLRIIQYARKKRKAKDDFADIINFCYTQPYLIEWKIMKSTCSLTASILISIINLTKHINRKFKEG